MRLGEIFRRVRQEVIGLSPEGEAEDLGLPELPINAQANIAGRKTASSAQIRIFQNPDTGATIETATVSADIPEIGIQAAAQGIADLTNGHEASVAQITGTVFSGSAQASVGSPRQPHRK